MEPPPSRGPASTASHQLCSDGVTAPSLAELALALWAAWGAPLAAAQSALLLRAYIGAGDVTGALRALQLAHHFGPGAAAVLALG